MECKFSDDGYSNEIELRIGDHEVPKSEHLRYLESLLQKNRKLNGDLNHRYKLDGCSGRVHRVCCMTIVC